MNTMVKAPGKFHQLKDAIVNVLTGAGGAGDAGGANFVAPVRLMYKDALMLYKYYWLARKVIDIPVQDMMRNGRLITNMDGDDLARYNAAWKQLKVDKVVAKALRYARLVGGAGIIPINNDFAMDEPHNPRDFVNGKLQRFVMVDAYNLKSHGAIIQDLQNPNYDMPSHFTHGGRSIHISNVIRAHGLEVPDKGFTLDQMGVAEFWGGSRLLFLKEPIINATIAWQAVRSMLVSNNVDILKVPGLYDSITACEDEGTQNDINQSMMVRAALYSRHKGPHNVAILDDKESIERIKYDFTGIPQVLHEMIQPVSGGADIPLTRLAGISPGGMNSTGESDLENYYSNIGSAANDDLRPVLDAIDYYMTLNVFGEVREVEYTINSPHIQTEAQEQAAATSEAATIKAINDMNIIPESMIVRRVQQNLMPEIPDDYIEALEAEESLALSDPKPDPLDDPDELDGPDDEGDGDA